MKTPHVDIIAINPIKPLLYGSAIFIILWTIAPINFIYKGGIKSITLLTLCFTFLFLGIALGARSFKSSKIKFQANLSQLKKLIKHTFTLGIIGISLRIFERVVLRAGGNISSDFAENRELISSGGSGPLALISATLASMLMFLPLFLFLSNKCGMHRRVHSIYFLASLTYPLFDVLYQGSRSTLVMYLSVLLISAATTQSINLKKIKTMAALVTIALPTLISLFGLSTYIFIERATQFGVDPISSMQISGYAKFAPASDTTLALLRESGISGISAAIYSTVNFCQYFLHGLYEFFYLAESTNSATTYGMIDFYIPVKVVASLLGNINIEEVIASGILRPGVYTTFFGPIIYDFGPALSAPACFFAGLVFGHANRRLKQGASKWLPFLLIVNSFISFALVVNLFTSGAGQYLTISSMIMLIIISRLKVFIKLPYTHLRSTQAQK
ncbi:hypothetical protein [Pseudomonas sp. Pseusp97]|uniref:hypothetical protein n=1 Tax=Pseudomonas sp. Pseusp97 TaxID=3243065 RepID=UPI0039A483FC